MSRTQTSIKTRNDLPEKTRQTVNTLLNLTLATASDLHSQIKQAHWTVQGPHFIALHKLFDELGAIVEAQIDTVAERISALGGIPQGTVRQAAHNSPLPELSMDALDGLTLVNALSDRFAMYGEQLRQHITDSTDANDDGTADLFTGLSRDVDQALWFLEAHLR
jgi:starvation-inducible DNA-binding protein